MINGPVLRKAMEYIDAHPDEWMQNRWVDVCGTAGCIAFIIALLAEDRVVINPQMQSVVTRDGQEIRIDDYAMGIAGLTSEQADKLFYSTNTLPRLREIVDELIALQ